MAASHRSQSVIAGIEEKALNIPPIDSTDLELGSVIGQGATSRAHKAIFRRKSCVAKVLKKEEEGGPSSHHAVLVEIETLSAVGLHPNIVELLGACLSNQGDPILILEFVEGRDLERHLSLLTPGFDLGRQTVCRWSLDILSALEFLHERDPFVIHGDIKPANLLLTACRTSLKLTDFGLAKTVDSSRRLLCAHRANEGSPRYRAPETLAASATANFTEKADVYSAALVIWYLLAGRRPDCDARDDPRRRPPALVGRWRWRALADLLERMWAAAAEDRPAAAECAALLRAAAAPPPPQRRAGCYAGLGWRRRARGATA
jgi:serine/threonine protein kinase